MERMINYTPQHLCDTCKFINKCTRFGAILNSLRSLEVEVFEKWKMNLKTALMIDECDLYKVDWEIVQLMQEGELDDEI